MNLARVLLVSFALVLSGPSLGAFATFAHAEKTKPDTVGYVDTTRVNATATEPVRLLGEVNADGQEKQREFNAAVEAFSKAKPADREVLRQKAQALSKMNADDFKKHDDEVHATLRKHLADVMAKLQTERHLTEVSAAPGLLLYPGVDLTDEVVKRLDAADADGLAAKAIADANARAEAAEKRARDAEAKLKAAPGSGDPTHVTNLPGAFATKP